MILSFKKYCSTYKFKKKSNNSCRNKIFSNKIMIKQIYVPTDNINKKIFHNLTLVLIRRYLSNKIDFFDSEDNLKTFASANDSKISKICCYLCWYQNISIKLIINCFNFLLSCN